MSFVLGSCTAIRHVPSSAQSFASRRVFTFARVVRANVFAWCSAKQHILLHLGSPCLSEGVLVCKGDVRRMRSLVAHHVVQGHIVFPGAAHLEVGLALVARLSSIDVSAATASLDGIIFIQPLVLDENGSELDVLCSLSSSGRFD
eukprot:3891522-Prymnesium_polylepis.1